MEQQQYATARGGVYSRESECDDILTTAKARAMAVTNAVTIAVTMGQSELYLITVYAYMCQRESTHLKTGTNLVIITIKRKKVTWFESD